MDANTVARTGQTEAELWLLRFFNMNIILVLVNGHSGDFIIHGTNFLMSIKWMVLSSFNSTVSLQVANYHNPTFLSFILY